jgi:hypothetical protein
VKLSFAYPDPAAQLLDTAVRAARKPSDSSQDSLIERDGMFQRCREHLTEDRSPGSQVELLNYLFQPYVSEGTLDGRHGHCLVQQF